MNRILPSNYSNFIIAALIFFMVSVSGCGARINKVDNDLPISSLKDLYLDVDYLEKYKHEIAEDIYKLIKERHPVTADDFPRIKVTDVRTVCIDEHQLDTEKFPEGCSGNYLRLNTEERIEIQRLLKEILETISQRFAAESNSEKIWEVTLDINKVHINKDPNLLKISAIFLYTLTCFDNFFIFLCPISIDDYLLIHASVNADHINGSKRIMAFGGAKELVAHPDGASNNYIRFDLTTKAFISAIASVTTGIVKMYENQKLSENKSNTTNNL